MSSKLNLKEIAIIITSADRGACLDSAIILHVYTCIPDSLDSIEFTAKCIRGQDDICMTSDRADSSCNKVQCDSDNNRHA
eukprot:scaffold101554_cov21-Prasinocladus_malaysianus.AAC.1